MVFWNDRPKDYHRRAAKVQEPNAACLRCAKAVKPGRGVCVEITIEGDILRPDDPRSNGSSSLGCWVLGADCARRLGVDWAAPWHGWGRPGGPA